MEHWIIIPVLFLLLVLSAFFSGTENAFISLNKFKLKTYSFSGSKRGMAIKRMTEDVELFYSTILLGNNLANFALTSLSTAFFISISPRYGTAYSSALVTSILLFFGEIIPKNIFRERAHYISYRIYPLLNFFKLLFLPVTFILSKLIRSIYSLLNIPSESRLDRISRNELFSVISSSQISALLPELGATIIERIFSFKQKKVSQALLPINEITAISTETPLSVVRKTFLKKSTEILLIYEGKHTNIVGYTVPNDTLNIEKDDIPISELMRDAVIVPEVIDLIDCVKLFEEDRIIVAVDEYGSVAGVLTLADIIDEILGEASNILTPQDFTSILINGKTSLEQLRIDFGIVIEDEDVNTAAGFILKRLKRIPEPGESVTFDGYRFLVKESGQMKIKKIEIRKIVESA